AGIHSVIVHAPERLPDSLRRASASGMTPRHSVLKREGTIELRQRPGTGKQDPRLLLVPLHLDDERVPPVELLFLAEEAEDGDRAGLAIKVVGEIEDEGLQQRHAVHVHRRASAETRHPIMQTAVSAAQADCINAVEKTRLD